MLPSKPEQRKIFVVLKVAFLLALGRRSEAEHAWAKIESCLFVAGGLSPRGLDMFRLSRGRVKGGDNVVFFVVLSGGGGEHAAAFGTCCLLKSKYCRRSFTGGIIVVLSLPDAGLVFAFFFLLIEASLSSLSLCCCNFCKTKSYALASCCPYA